MCRVMQTSSCPLRLRRLYHVSKLTIPSSSGEKTSSSSMMLSGLTFPSIPAYNRTFTTNVFMPAIAKAQRHWCSRANNLVYSSSSLSVSGKNSKCFETSSKPPPPPTRTQRISQPVYTASHQSVMVSTPVVPLLTSTSEPSTPLFLSKGQTTTTTSSSVFDRPILQDIQRLRDSYVGVFTV